MRRIHGILLAVLWSVISYAQDKGEDKFVRLMSAQSVVNEFENGQTIRKAVGPARFLHNDTWLICDSAVWNVDTNIIYALGNVVIEQDETELRSDKLTYYADSSRAEFRGSIVELIDKDQNILRTRHLDYFTEDSVAVFKNGASMKSKDGQIIESDDGTYESKIKTFTFTKDVNMFSDSVFVKTEELLYNTDISRATFPNYVEAWNEDRMLSGLRGHYDDKDEIFFITDHVHMMNTTQEGWCDSLHFFQKTNSLIMDGNVQMHDNEKKVMSLAGHVDYRDSLSFMRMTKDPLIFSHNSSKDESGKEQIDSIFVRADTIFYWKVVRADMDSLTIVHALALRDELESDPISESRKINRDLKQQKEKEAQEKIAAKEAPAMIAQADDGFTAIAKEEEEEDEEFIEEEEILFKEEERKEVDMNAEIVHVMAYHNVKLYRPDMQMACDSLRYFDIDSTVRLYNNPAVWNTPQHQYNADSIYVRIKDGNLRKANLISNAFIHVEEVEGKLYDQIKGQEMVAYFDENGDLERFDALGGASAIFYMKEKEDFAIANKSESNMLSATFKDGDLSSISYYESPKSDALPIAQMGNDDKWIKGFNWTPERRPDRPESLSKRRFRNSERYVYLGRPRPEFKHTAKYYKGYMDEIYHQIEERQEAKDRQASIHNGGENISGQLDSLENAPLNLKRDKVAVTDSLTIEAAVDTMGVTPINNIESVEIAATEEAEVAANDEAEVKVDAEITVDAEADLVTAADTVVVESKAEMKARLKQERKAKRDKAREARIQKREARWNAIEAKAALKEAQKYAKKKARKEAKEALQAERREKERIKEENLIKKYRDKYLRKSL